MNALKNETSPYLLQHAGNPVDWYPWGEQALNRAREEDKPILLSIGYSACHWCHVMERESFENEYIAALMNEHFVNIKVDREERPDLDTIYMGAVQLMTGRGGWPMTVFLTPEQVPFYGGTYFPPEDRFGLPGFPRILLAVAQAYGQRRDEVRRDAAALVDELRRSHSPAGSPGPLRVEVLDTAARKLMAHYDDRHGGFGGAPKFPPAMALSFLLLSHRRTGDARLLAAVEHTLEKMADGGVYDQLGGGFHRYSVDDHWLVPHFEKMLYDNALLSRVYVDAWLLTRKPLYRRVAEETIDYVLREMTSPEGGFYSTQDADSEGKEGKYFVWTPEEVMSLLGEEDGTRFCRFFDVSPQGNFEGKSILHVPRTVEAAARMGGMESHQLEELLARGRKVLLAARESRIKPARDEKTLTAWNGMMLRSVAEAARAFDRDDYRRAAEKNGEFALAGIRADGRLFRCGSQAGGGIPGYLEDYACLADGMITLYETTFDVRWYRAAVTLGTSIVRLFGDDSAPGLFFTARDQEKLILRAKDFYDNATPSGNSVAAEVFLRLWKLTGDDAWRLEATRILEAMTVPMSNHPSAFGCLLGVLDLALARPVEIAIAGDPAAPGTRALLREVFRRYLPNKVVACGPEGSVPLLRNRGPVGTRPAAYVCENFFCAAPVTSSDDLAALLTRHSGP